MTDHGRMELMNMYVKNVLTEMKRISKQTTKKDMYEHIQAWENELETATYITDYN